MKRASLIAALCLLLLPAAALADTINFGVAFTGGSVTTNNNYSASGTITGSFTTVITFTGIGTPVCNGCTGVDAGTLSFSGNNEDWNTTGSGASTVTDYQFSLTSLSVNTASGYGANATTFTGPIILDMSCSKLGSGSSCTLNFDYAGAASGSITGTTAAAFGEPTTTWDIGGSVNATSTSACVYLGNCGGPGNAFALAGNYGGISAVLGAPPGVPEPATLSLLGMGLMGLLGLRKRS